MSKTSIGNVGGLSFNYRNGTYKLTSCTREITFTMDSHSREICMIGNNPNELTKIECLHSYFFNITQEYFQQFREKNESNFREHDIINKYDFFRFRITNVYIKNLDIEYFSFFKKISFILENSVFEKLSKDNYRNYGRLKVNSVPEEFIEEFLFGENGFCRNGRIYDFKMDFIFYYHKYLNKRIRIMKEKYLDLIESSIFLLRKFNSLSREIFTKDRLKNLEEFEEYLEEKRLKDLSKDLSNDLSLF